MLFHGFRALLTRSLNGSSRQSSGSSNANKQALQKRRALSRRRAAQQPGQIESLDSRLMLTVTTIFNAGALTVTSDAADDITIATDTSGNVTVNGNSDPTGNGAFSASTVTSIGVTGGAGDNAIDLAGVTTAAFTSLTSVSVDGGDGNDEIGGSEFDDSLNGGAGDDQIAGRGGDDTLIGGTGADNLIGDDETISATFTTNFGDIELELFPDVAPVTVQNFLNYIEDGDYDNSIFHRLASGFVLQGGGFTTSSNTFTSSAQFTNVPTDPQIVNEFNLSNTRGTIAMAKLGGNPDSATSQWFVNLADNSGNLDNQNGGFTVFGQVRDLTLVDQLAQFGTVNAGGAFTDLPVDGSDTLIVVQSVGTGWISASRGTSVGDDTFIWNDGDGSDVVEGASGNDAQIVQTGAADETVVISNGGNGGFVVGRTSGTNFTISDRGIETLDINTGDGDDTVTINSLAGVTGLTDIAIDGDSGADTFNITPTTGLTIDINGDAPNGGVGDKLNYLGSGIVAITTAATRSGTIVGTDTINFSEIEDVQTSTTRQLTVSSLSQDEGDSGTVDFSFTAALSYPATQDITVDIDVMDDTATSASGDFVAEATRTVLIPAGSTTSSPFTVTVNGDTLTEGDETFRVVPSNASVATGALNFTSGVGTILNDEPAIEVSVVNGVLQINDVSGGSLSADITVTLDTGSNEFVVTSPASVLITGSSAPMTEVRVSATTVTGGLLANLGLGDDRLDASSLLIPVTLNGGSGNDTLIGGSANDSINGDAGDDSLRGDAGNDALNGGAGNDSLYGSAGLDTLIGGDGDDRLKGQGGVDSLDGGAGIDRLDGGGSGNFLSDEVEGLLMLENDGYRTTRGDVAQTSGSFVAVTLAGGTGDDTLQASNYSGGNVVLLGNDGNDRLLGGRFNDILEGGNGDDYLQGSAGRDLLRGGAGNDVLRGQGSADTLFGGAGNDELQGGTSHDQLFGEDGNDSLTGESGRDLLSGGFGNDLVQGGDDRDTLGGDLGDDTIDGGDGPSYLREEADADFTLSRSGADVVTTGLGTDTRTGSFVAAYLIGGPSGNTIDASGFTDRVTILGGGGNDSIIGSRAQDVIDGGDGDDTILAGGGRDAVNGGAGNDSILGGAEQDTILGGDGNDTLFGEGLQDLILGEAGDDSISGGLLPDQVTGGGNGVAASTGDVLDLGTADNVDDTLTFDFERLTRGI
jgi:Ca2+-binding RTX toxin-like protein